jgi:hypothetical protein
MENSITYQKRGQDEAPGMTSNKGQSLWGGPGPGSSSPLNAARAREGQTRILWTSRGRYLGSLTTDLSSGKSSVKERTAGSTQEKIRSLG